MKYQDLRLSDPVKFLHLVQAVALFAAIVAIVFWVTDNQQEIDEESLRNRVSESSLAFKAQLEAEINSNIFLVNGLAATISSYPDLPADKIDLALEALYKLGRHVRNIGLAPANHITHIYPLAGNQSAIGMYYPEIPSQWPAVKAAIASRQTILTGPLTLIQGGRGLISRTPVYLENGEYWGILSLVLDYDSLLTATRKRAEASDLQIAIRNMEIFTEIPVFFGSAAVFEQEPVTTQIQLPGNYWELAAVPKTGWKSDPLKYSTMQMGGLFLALLTMVIFLSYQRSNLRTLTSLSRLKAILDTTHDGIILVDTRGILREFNPAAEKLFGYKAEEVLDRPLSILLKPEDRQQHMHYMRSPEQTAIRKVNGGRLVTGLCKDGSEVSIEVTIGQARISNEVCFVSVIRDVTERKAYEEQLQKLAQTDSLTGALNRRAFHEIADKTFATAKRYKRPLSLLSLDIDYFKAINDTWGHDAGDKVLVELVSTLHAQLRSVDTFCRLGGEEFVILLPETDMDQAFQTAEKLRLVLARMEVAINDSNDIRITFTASIGVAPLTPDIYTLSQLLTGADAALYEAKGAGRNCTAVLGREFLHSGTYASGRKGNPRIKLVR